jgi:hypothetical protein
LEEVNEADSYRFGERFEELSLALAQATMQQAIKSSGLDKGTVAMRFCDSPRKRWAIGHLNRLLSGDCDLTVRDMGRLFAICGFEPRFFRIPRLVPAGLVPLSQGRSVADEALAKMVAQGRNRRCKPSWLRKGIKVQCLDSGGGVFVVEMVEKASRQHPAFFTVRRQKSMRESRIVSCTADVMRSWVRWEG